MLKTIINIKLFEVTVPEETGGRIALMKLLRQTVEEKIGRSEASITSDFLGDLIAYLGDSVPPLEKTQVEKDMEKVQKEYKQLKLKQEAELKQLKKKTKDSQDKCWRQSRNITRSTWRDKTQGRNQQPRSKD